MPDDFEAWEAELAPPARSIVDYTDEELLAMEQAVHDDGYPYWPR